MQLVCWKNNKKIYRLNRPSRLYLLLENTITASPTNPYSAALLRLFLSLSGSSIKSIQELPTCYECARQHQLSLITMFVSSAWIQFFKELPLKLGISVYFINNQEKSR